MQCALNVKQRLLVVRHESALIGNFRKILCGMKINYWRARRYSVTGLLAAKRRESKFKFSIALLTKILKIFQKLVFFVQTRGKLSLDFIFCNSSKIIHLLQSSFRGVLRLTLTPTPKEFPISMIRILWLKGVIVFTNLARTSFLNFGYLFRKKINLFNIKNNATILYYDIILNVSFVFFPTLPRKEFQFRWSSKHNDPWISIICNIVHNVSYLKIVHSALNDIRLITSFLMFY